MRHPVEPSDAEARFVEQAGLFFEERGLPRMAGRMIGWLLICDPPHQSAAELAAALRASKGSISQTTRLLEQMGLAERLTLPGHRRVYFRMRPGAWDTLLRHGFRRLTEFNRVVEQGMRLMEGRPAALRRRLEEVYELYAFFERELPALLERWEREHRRAQP